MHLRSTIAVATLVLCALSAPVLAQVGWQREFPKNSFSNPIIDLGEIVYVIPKDNIPAIDNPVMISVADTGDIGDREPVMTVELPGEAARAYPIRYLMWHEIANDEVGETAFSVTYCPLCNSGLVFDRRVKGDILTFAVSGKLRNSDMVMYDRETDTLWQQALGEGLVGEHAGTKLVQLPAWMESWGEFRARNPDGYVMDEPKARRRYGTNPYVGYDSGEPWARFYSGEMPPHGINPMMRVVRVGEQAWTFERLREEGEIRENGVTLTWSAGQASALDGGIINNGREVGTVRVRDAAGYDLPHDVMFAFAYHAFFPQGAWMLGAS